MSRRIIHCGRCGTAGHNVTTCTSTARGPGVSRQRLWQIRRVLEGRCQQCGKPAVTAHHCAECRDKARALQLQRLRRLRIRRIRKGLCVLCGENDARYGQRCASCHSAAANPGARPYHCTNCNGRGHQRRSCPDLSRGAA